MRISIVKSAVLIMTACAILLCGVSCGASTDTSTVGTVINSSTASKAEETEQDVTLILQNTVYAPESGEIKATWKNNSDQSIQFGHAFTIEQLSDNAWVEVTASETLVFDALGIGLLKDGEYDYTYPIRAYSDTLTAGRYRIKAEYRQGDAEKAVTAEFTVE